MATTFLRDQVSMHDVATGRRCAGPPLRLQNSNARFLSRLNVQLFKLVSLPIYTSKSCTIMTKKIALALIWSMIFSCKPPGSTLDNPCYRCQISETFRGMTKNSYWDRCGTASVANFIQTNTYQQSVTQGNVPYTLSRVTTCVPK